MSWRKELYEYMQTSREDLLSFEVKKAFFDAKNALQKIADIRQKLGLQVEPCKWLNSQLLTYYASFGRETLAKIEELRG